MSVKLARYIASQKKNVILVLADMSAPPLPYICPPSDLEAETSLGNILGAAHVDENLIKQNAILHVMELHGINLKGLIYQKILSLF